MIPNKLQIKVFASDLDPTLVPKVIPIFHRWITERVLGEVLVDVADYRHVFQGPGIALIGHESNYYLDEQGGRLGFVCFRKRGFVEDGEPLLDALRRTLVACELLERELAAPGKLFNPGRLEVSIADRTATRPPFHLTEFAAHASNKLSAVYQKAPHAELVSDGNLPAVNLHWDEPQQTSYLLSRLTVDPTNSAPAS